MPSLRSIPLVPMSPSLKNPYYVENTYRYEPVHLPALESLYFCKRKQRLLCFQLQEGVPNTAWQHHKKKRPPQAKVKPFGDTVFLLACPPSEALPSGYTFASVSTRVAAHGLDDKSVLARKLQQARLDADSVLLSVKHFKTVLDLDSRAAAQPSWVSARGTRLTPACCLFESRTCWTFDSSLIQYAFVHFQPANKIAFESSQAIAFIVMPHK